MNSSFVAAMRRATRSLRARNVIEATRAIREALAPHPPSAPAEETPDDRNTPAEERPRLRLIEGDRETARPEPAPAAAEAKPDPAGGADARPAQRPRRPLPEVLSLLRRGGPSADAFASLPGMKVTGTPTLAEGAQFLARRFAGAAGTRDYKLYIPAATPDRPRPSGLIIMLHGCKQNPDDFAVGTNMNTVAEAHGLLVAYPAQVASANPSSCWNWFNPADQVRDAGEPAIVAGITRALASEYGLARDQVFVAGLSAGGAMAVVMGETYPDVYAAVGVHSGLAYRVASDVVSAFAAMRGEATSPVPSRRGAASDVEYRPRAIVFHGSADQTVHPANAARILSAVAAAHLEAGLAEQEFSGVDGGRAYTRTTVVGSNGVPVAERWLVEGSGHAWSGGQPGGSFTDRQGPDASAEMVRFFLGRPG